MNVPSFEIGKDNWAKVVREFAESLDKAYFAEFQTVTAGQIADVETKVNRQLPDDYKTFLLEFGAGSFTEEVGGGGFYTPEELCIEPSCAIYFFTGTAGEVSDEIHERFYRSYGKDNGAPDVFTTERITHDGVNLLDMFQIGSNGACCYHALHVGPEPKPFGYALMSDCHDFEDQAATFSEGLAGILEQHWEYVNEVWE